MRILRTLLALALCMALALPCALAEDAYVPGETMKALFAEAWSKGQMITSDLSLQVKLNAETLGLSEEEEAAAGALATVLDATALRMGTCKIDGGVRLLLAGMVTAQEGAQDVYADIAMDITREGISIDSTLLEGRRVTATWSTVLQMFGMSEEEAAMALQLLDADFSEAAAQIMQLVETYGTMAMQVIAPYAGTIGEWAQTLTVETMTDVQATEDYPYTATLYNVYITEKDLGVLIKALADQLAQDTTLCALLDGLAAQLGDESFPGTAALCAQLSESAASLTDEEHPLILSLGMDEAGTPMYVEAYNTQSDNSGEYAGFFFYKDAADPALYNYELSAFTLDTMGNAKDGMMLWGTCKTDAADPLAFELTMDAVVVADRETVCGISYTQSCASAATAEGLPGMKSSAEMTMSVGDGEDAVMMLLNLQSTSGLTSRGGEQSDVLETVNMYVGEDSVSINVLGTMIVEPGENGLTGSYSILEKMPDTGIDTYGIQMIFASADYTPAELTAIAFETMSDEDITTLVDDVYSSVMTVAEQMLQAYPEDALQTLMELTELTETEE